MHIPGLAYYCTVPYRSANLSASSSVFSSSRPARASSLLLRFYLRPSQSFYRNRTVRKGLIKVIQCLTDEVRRTGWSQNAWELVAVHSVLISQPERRDCAILTTNKWLRMGRTEQILMWSEGWGLSMKQWMSEGEQQLVLWCGLGICLQGKSLLNNCNPIQACSGVEDMIESLDQLCFSLLFSSSA